MDSLYSVKQASDLTGISKPALRQYTEKYQKWLSAEATPEKGVARQFTAQDLKLLRFVYQLTSTGMSHTQVEYQLDSGELERYAWSVDDEDVAEPESTALLPQDLVSMARAMIEEYKQKAEESVLREREAQQRIVELERELGIANGRLSEVKALRWRAPAWVKAIFGSRGD